MEQYDALQESIEVSPSAAAHACRNNHHSLTEDTMWSITTSRGSRVDGISSEASARGAVQMLGYAAPIGPYSWQVTDNQGHRFVAELRRGR